MSLLGWLRRCLFTIKVAVGVILGKSANTTIIQTSIPPITGHPAAITPTATFAPTVRIDSMGIIPGALPQAIYCCAFSARSLRGHHHFSQCPPGPIKNYCGTTGSQHHHPGSALCFLLFYLFYLSKLPFYFFTLLSFSPVPFPGV